MPDELLTPEHSEIFADGRRRARAGRPRCGSPSWRGADALTRFANNTIHQNVAERERALSVRPVIGSRTARASTNRLDPDSIRARGGRRPSRSRGCPSPIRICCRWPNPRLSTP